MKMKNIIKKHVITKYTGESSKSTQKQVNCGIF